MRFRKIEIIENSQFTYKGLCIYLMNHIYNIKNYLGKIQVIDFLRGSEDYKFRIGCVSSNLLTLSLGD